MTVGFSSTLVTVMVTVTSVRAGVNSGRVSRSDFDYACIAGLAH